MIWREKRIPLGILGVFLLANAVFFFTYRVQYENRLSALEADKHAAEQRLEQLRARRAQTEQQIAAYRKAQAEIARIYNDRWSTVPERFTALINEVKRLETASQLIGRSHGFAQSEKDVKEAAGLGTNVVTISFSVQGTYAQVRRLINLLELSDQFVIIDAIGLSGNAMAGIGEGEPGASPPAPAGANVPPAGPLTLTLRLKTIFRSTLPLPADKPNQQL
jgi:cell division protein FtsB